MREILCSVSTSYLLTHDFEQMCFRPCLRRIGLANKVLRPGAPRVGDVGAQAKDMEHVIVQG